MKLLRLIPSLLILLSFSCSSSLVTVEDSAYENFDLTDYQTFDFFEIENTNPSNPNFEKAIELFKKEIGEAMLSRNIKQSSNPDIKVNLGIIIEDKVQTRTTNLATDPFMYSGQRSYTWKSEEVPVNTYREGSVTMHLVDTKNNQVVWLGTINRVVPNKDEKKAEAIRFAVTELFKEIDKE